MKRPSLASACVTGYLAPHDQRPVVLRCHDRPARPRNHAAHHRRPAATAGAHARALRLRGVSLLPQGARGPVGARPRLPRPSGGARQSTTCRARPARRQDAGTVPLRPEHRDGPVRVRRHRRVPEPDLRERYGSRMARAPPELRRQHRLHARERDAARARRPLSLRKGTAAHAAGHALQHGRLALLPEGPRGAQRARHRARRPQRSQRQPEASGSSRRAAGTSACGSRRRGRWTASACSAGASSSWRSWRRPCGARALVATAAEVHAAGRAVTTRPGTSPARPPARRRAVRCAGRAGGTPGAARASGGESRPA